jgi:hypothetical protein
MGKLAGLAAAGVLASGGAAHAATLEIQNAAVRVVVIPEERADVSVTVLHANPRLPLKVSTGPLGDVIVDGGFGYGRLGPPLAGVQLWLWQRPATCGPQGPGGWMWVLGLGQVSYEDLPQVVARVPMDARVSADAAVFGEIGPAGRVELKASSCGAWTIANVQGPLVIRNTGAARIRAGDAARMTLIATSLGSIEARNASADLDARNTGSGDIKVARASGAIAARVTSSGSIHIGGGDASNVRALTTGSGDIRFGGRARTVQAGITSLGGIDLASVSDALDVSITGSGNMGVDRADGAVRARLSSLGALRVAEGHATSVSAKLSGSGGVSFGGAADRLDARTSSVGGVRVGSVLGAMDTASSGSGRIVVAGR